MTFYKKLFKPTSYSDLPFKNLLAKTNIVHYKNHLKKTITNKRLTLRNNFRKSQLYASPNQDCSFREPWGSWFTES